MDYLKPPKTDGQWLEAKLRMLALGEAAGYWEGVRWHLRDNRTGGYTSNGGDEIVFDPVEQLNRLASERPAVQTYLNELHRRLDIAIEYETVHGRLSLATESHPFWRMVREFPNPYPDPPTPSDLFHFVRVNGQFGSDKAWWRPSVPDGYPSSE